MDTTDNVGAAAAYVVTNGVARSRWGKGGAVPQIYFTDEDVRFAASVRGAPGRAGVAAHGSGSAGLHAFSTGADL